MNVCARLPKAALQAVMASAVWSAPSQTRSRGGFGGSILPSDDRTASIMIPHRHHRHSVHSVLETDHMITSGLHNQITKLRMGLHRCRQVRVPMMTPVHRRKSQQWTREHQNWTTEQWKKVAWSDESRFLLHHVDNRASEGCAEQTSLIHGGSTSQLTGLKGSAANILVRYHSTPSGV